MRRAFPALLLVALVWLAGCGGEVTPDEKFVDTFVELRVIEMTYGADSPMARLLRTETLKKSGYTRDQFLKKTESILNDEREWLPFQKAVVTRIDSALAEIQRADEAERDSLSEARSHGPKVEKPKAEIPKIRKPLSIGKGNGKGKEALE